MAVVYIPALLRELTGGEESARVPGATVREVIDALEARFPGVKTRLYDGERLRPGITVIVDGAVSSQRLRHRLEENSEVHFLPALSGGSGLTESLPAVPGKTLWNDCPYRW